jgi:SAM-dependent methyltransferase
LKEGDRIADLGSAAGFHCLQFSERVGASGKVIAIESRTELRRYLSDIIRNEGIQNMKLGADVLALEEGSLDVAFMGDTYSTFYYAMRTAERTPVMTNIRKALRPGGKLVILGTPVPDRSKGVVFAPLAVSADLVALQVEAYGFRRAGAHAVNPLRYLLLFTVE